LASEVAFFHNESVGDETEGLLKALNRPGGSCLGLSRALDSHLRKTVCQHEAAVHGPWPVGPRHEDAL